MENKEYGSTVLLLLGTERVGFYMYGWYIWFASLVRITWYPRFTFLSNLLFVCTSVLVLTYLSFSMSESTVLVVNCFCGAILCSHVQADSRVWAGISARWDTSITSLVFYWSPQWIFCSAGLKDNCWDGTIWCTENTGWGLSQGYSIQPIGRNYCQAEKQSTDSWKLESEAIRDFNKSYILHDPDSASSVKEQHQHFSPRRISIPSSLHVPQGDISGLCPPRYHQKVGFDILQAALASHGQGHSGLLRFILKLSCYSFFQKYVRNPVCTLKIIMVDKMRRLFVCSPVLLLLPFLFLLTVIDWWMANQSSKQMCFLKQGNQLPLNTCLDGDILP